MPGDTERRVPRQQPSEPELELERQRWVAGNGERWSETDYAPRLVALERQTAALAAAYASLENAFCNLDRRPLSDADLDAATIRFWNETSPNFQIGDRTLGGATYALVEAAVKYGYGLRNAA